MPAITPAILDAIFYNLDTRFQDAFTKTPTWYERLSTTIPSSGRENRYGWLQNVPGMREWVGERVLHGLAARGHSIVNKDYELTIKVPRNDIEDDNLGVFSPMAGMVAQQAKKWPDQIIKTALQAGASTLCWDGQYFFDTDHPKNYDDSSAGTYANRFTSTGLTANNYATVRSTMMSFVDDRGESLQVMPTTLFVPPQLEATGRAILNAEYIAPTAATAGNAGSVMQTNVMRNSAELVVLPELANEGTVWYLADTSKAIKPLIFQLRKAPQFAALFSPTDINVFMHKEYVYGVDSRGAAGYALPFLMSRCEA